MQLILDAPGLLIGLIGWAATAFLLFDSARFNAVQRRALLVVAWMLWMIPAFNALVLRGLLSSDTAILTCGGITVALALGLSLSALRASA